MKSRNIQADILDVLLDGKVHTYKEIAKRAEVCSKTVYRHIQALAYRFNIDTFRGGIDKGGVKLIKERQINVEKLGVLEMQEIINALQKLKQLSVNIKVFIKNLLQIKEQKELENESRQKRK